MAGEYKDQDSNLGKFSFEAYAACIWKGVSLWCVLLKSHSAEALIRLFSPLNELGELQGQELKDRVPHRHGC